MSIPRRAYLRIYRVAGEFVISWGAMEAALVLLLAVVYQSAGGKNHDAKIWVAFKRRVKFLRRCFRLIDGLKPHEAEMASILTEMQELIPFRSALVHGYISGFDPIMAKYTFTSFETDDTINSHRVSNFTTPLTGITAAVVRIGNLTDRLHTLTESLMKAFVR